MANTKLAQAQIAAITDDDLDRGNPNYPNDPGVKVKGMCSRFNRCGTRKAYKNKYQSLFGGSAIETGENFRDAGMVVSLNDLQVGDFLVKMTGSGGYGHIGSYVDRVPGHSQGGLMAENSSTSVGRVSGGKGYRTLEQFGTRGVLVCRLPPLEVEEQTVRLFLNDKQIAIMPLIEGKSYCKAETWAKALGFELAWDEEERRVLFDGKPLPADVPQFNRNGRAFIHITALTTAAKLNQAYDGIRHRVVVTPKPPEPSKAV